LLGAKEPNQPGKMHYLLGAIEWKGRMRNLVQERWTIIALHKICQGAWQLAGLVASTRRLIPLQSSSSVTEFL